MVVCGWREMAAESIYKERCLAVDDGVSWGKYMSISGSPDDEYDIINLQYTEDGLLTVDENRGGHAAAFGDDIAIECLATEFKREIFVVRQLSFFLSFFLSNYYFTIVSLTMEDIHTYAGSSTRIRCYGWWRQLCFLLASSPEEWNMRASNLPLHERNR